MKIMKRDGPLGLNSMKYVYGPVPSRRLGFSLGVDLVPYKTCSLDCIYCQLGKTTQKTVERKMYTRREDVCAEIEEVLKKTKQIDYITFSGSGEPTLNSEIGILIKAIKKITAVPIAVLTNGTLLFREDVRKDLEEADVVLPSLDAVSDRVFEKINRPHEALKIDSIVDGLKRFRVLYRGQIWLEVMLVKNVNDNIKELRRIRNVISEIQPDKVCLNTVVRPPAEIYARPLGRDEMIAAKNLLDKNCEVIAEFHGRKAEEVQHVENAILEMSQRRPLTIIDIANVFGISETNAEKYVNSLKESGRLKEKKYKKAKYLIYNKN
jgi:wyosine [tRNA(Phe)-imidazoG37] synthetase (radical SAM superfamily)